MRRSILFFLFLSCLVTLALTQEVHDDHTHDDHTHDDHTHDDHTHDDHTHDDHTHGDHLATHTHSDAEASHGHSHAAGYDEETCAVEENQPYDLNFRVGSLFIILGTSAVGIFAPILLYRIRPSSSNNGVRHWILTIAKFFGTGVILATSFVHMLPEAMERFHSPCLGSNWQAYHGFGGVFCMVAAFVLQWIELAAMAHLDANQHHHGSLDEEKTTQTIKGDGHMHSVALEQDLSVRTIHTLLLELGIAIHSIIIGITLGTTSEGPFLALFIALIFHQFFEGVALGTRINDLQYVTWIKPLVMSLTFICMTPLGVAIGIGIRSALHVSSMVLAQAILDAFSAGILLYNAYVSLMSVEISNSVSFRRSSFARKSVCLLSMYLGAAVMSVLGIWA
ncbi:ZIP zinc transporter-domain-containing protein [Halteromyces radiatus]|uniref:ZIP zinc transporter-domain-containing protein n=1 Tax=Halteromyces radiatus TaxID=101107 RepID=UPI00221FB44E|nr:ZIP zinc transporter-domain-containing protein [Halteromyces radiatus]KAI8096465.1 ZIP zinc transporter-domain-containing protein [Halteromyces radiatus]